MFTSAKSHAENAIQVSSGKEKDRQDWGREFGGFMGVGLGVLMGSGD